MSNIENSPQSSKKDIIKQIYKDNADKQKNLLRKIAFFMLIIATATKLIAIIKHISLLIEAKFRYRFFVSLHDFQNINWSILPFDIDEHIIPIILIFIIIIEARNLYGGKKHKTFLSAILGVIATTFIVYWERYNALVIEKGLLTISLFTKVSRFLLIAGLCFFTVVSIITATKAFSKREIF